MKAREWIYGALAIGAVIAGWYYNLQFMQQPDAGWGDWIRQCMLNPASSSALMDLSFAYVILDMLIVLEARRLNMRWAWAYVASTVFVSLGFGAGLFLLMRERKLRTATPAS